MQKNPHSHTHMKDKQTHKKGIEKSCEIPREKNFQLKQFVNRPKLAQCQRSKLALIK